MFLLQCHLPPFLYLHEKILDKLLHYLFSIIAVNYAESNNVAFLSTISDWIDQSKGSSAIRDKKQVKSGNSHDKNKFARTHRLSK